jgi:peptidoglycan/LPS O-acetylase OafA/YrhL
MNNGLILPQLINVMAVCLVFACFESVNDFMTPFLNLKFIQNIGKISYGIYLYHKPIPTFFGLLTSKLNIPIPDNKYILFLIYLLVTYIVASLSWKLIESPIGKLKNKFDL